MKIAELRKYIDWLPDDLEISSTHASDKPLFYIPEYPKVILGYEDLVLLMDSLPHFMAWYSKLDKQSFIDLLIEPYAPVGTYTQFIKDNLVNDDYRFINGDKVETARHDLTNKGKCFAFGFYLAIKGMFLKHAYAN